MSECCRKYERKVMSLLLLRGNETTGDIQAIITGERTKRFSASTLLISVKTK